MRIIATIIYLFLVLAGQIMADSAIVWSGQQDIKMGPGASPDWLPSYGWWFLDMNSDGMNDLRLEYIQDFTVQTQNGSAVRVTPQPPYSILDAVPLASGATIGAGNTWGTGTYPLVDWESVPGFGLMGCGSWAWVTNGYLGVSFTATDGVHYGWVRISSYDTMGAHIHDWAYESQPGVSIEAGVVPEPSTMALCVMGMVILLAIRLRRATKGVRTLNFGGRCKYWFDNDVEMTSEAFLILRSSLRSGGRTAGNFFHYLVMANPPNVPYKSDQR